MAARLVRTNTRSSSRLGKSGSENVFTGAKETVGARPHSAAPSALGDITNISAQNYVTSRAAVKPAAKVLAAPPPSSRLPVHADVGVSWAARAEARREEDAQEGSDPQSVVEYVPDIYANLREDEKGSDQPCPEYMDQQIEVNARMRSILVDWLCEVALKYKMRSETLFLAISILDRFLARKRVSRKKLQLVGVVALLIAAKYEEIYPPEIRKLVYICEEAYSKEEILQVEVVMLTVLEFQLRAPTMMPFLDRFTKVNGCNDMHRQVVQYLAELSLLELRMIRYPPSHLAAATVFLSNKLLKQHPSWSQEMVAQTSYQEATIRDCAKELCTVLEAAPTSKMQAVQKKFASATRHGVSKIPW